MLRNVNHLSALKSSIAVAFALTVVGCQESAPDKAESSVETTASANAFTDALRKNADLSTSAKLIDMAQLSTAVDGKGSYTLFLPTDDAWASLDATERNAIESEESRSQLIAVLRQHIAPGYVLAADLERGISERNGAVTLTTMGAMPVTLRRKGEAIMLGDGADAPRIVGQPIVAGNDVIYRIDRLIPPPS